MSTYVLVHGAWHGSWCWDKVAPLLEAKGHKVIAPDLPGHGADKTPISEITLDSYAARVCEVLDAQPEPVILVGHSMGGGVITQTADHRPGRIKTLVYLCGFLPRNGESIRSLAKQDPDSVSGRNRVIDEDGGFSTVKEEALREAFYADCPDEDVERATSLRVPEALAPSQTPVKTTEENFGRVHRIYIQCLRDRSISPALQKRMCEALPCEKVLDLETARPFSLPLRARGIGGPSDIDIALGGERLHFQQPA